MIRYLYRFLFPEVANRPFLRYRLRLPIHASVEHSALMQMRRKILRAAVVLFLLLVVGTCAAALDPSKHIKQYVHNTWTSLDGLPQNSILAIQQTQDGYLWFGTQEGLVRFNGVQFTFFNQANTPGLKKKAVTSLL